MVAAAIVGAAVVGAGTTAVTASKAAKAQKNAATEAKATAESTFEKQAALQEPFLQGGLTAQNRLFELLGLGPRPVENAMTPQGLNAYGLTPVNLPDIMGRQYGDTSYLTGAGGEYMPDFLPKGERVQLYRDPQGNIITDVNAYVAEHPLPESAAGTPAKSDYGKYARDFSMSDFEADPGYGFRMSEGMKALERSAAARGGLLSGSTLKGIQRFGQDLASTEYTNAFNRYQINRNNQLNPLLSIMGAGQNATNTLTNAAGAAGANEIAAITNAGNARASGYVGVGNAISQGLGSIAGYYANQPLTNAMIGYYNRGAAGSNAATGGAFGGGGGMINQGYITPFVGP